MNPFDEMDGIMRAYILLLRQANMEKRVMESALQKIARGCGAPQRQAMDALISIERLRGKQDANEPVALVVDLHLVDRGGVAVELSKPPGAEAVPVVEVADDSELVRIPESLP